MNIKINVPKNPALAVKMLIDAGYEAGVVGGCTRDAILGEEPYDWDICTSALPHEIQSVFKNFKQLTVGLKHGTVAVIIANEKIEITTYRIDGEYSDNRRPNNVTFTRSLIEDLRRRDYTQNAIFFNEFEGIIDPFNGVSDIKDKTIRAVGNADKRFQEDALRILRGIRFASKLGFEVEPSTKSAMFKNKKLLKNISQERITEEFVKTLQGKNASNTLDEFREIIAYIIPEIQALMDFNDPNSNYSSSLWKHTLMSMNNVEGLILKLTLFFHDIGKPSFHTTSNQTIIAFHSHADFSSKLAMTIFKRMKLTSASGINGKDIKNILELIKYHDTLIEPRKNSVRKMLSTLKGDTVQFKQLLSIKRAHALAKAPSDLIESLKEIDEIEIILNRLIAEGSCTTLKDLAVTGKDLIALGIPAGNQIGTFLKELLEAVLNENLENDKEKLLSEVQKKI